MLLGKELFDEEFFSINRGFLTISYSEKMRVNGQEFNTMKETLNYLKTQKSITQCIRLEFPISFHEQFPKEFRDKIVFLDKFIEIIQDLNQINFNYILLEKNTQLELDIWMSTQKAYSEYAIYLNNESRKILSDRKELLSIVCLIISSESYSDQLQLQNPLQNELTLLRKIQRNNNIENKSINQNQENQKSTNSNQELRKTQNLRQNFDSSELSSNDGQNCFKAQLGSFQNEKYFQCVPLEQFQIYNSENQNNFIFLYKGYQQFINNNQSLIEAEQVKQESDNIQKRICLDSIKTVEQVHEK